MKSSLLNQDLKPMRVLNHNLIILKATTVLRVQQETRERFLSVQFARSVKGERVNEAAMKACM